MNNSNIDKSISPKQLENCYIIWDFRKLEEKRIKKANELKLPIAKKWRKLKIIMYG